MFGAKAIAGIGKLPDTVADRSIPIELKRRRPGEAVERFRLRKVDSEALPLQSAAAAWAEAHLEALAEAEPELPEELDDRAQDIIEPLLAIADEASREWPERAQRAAVALLAGGSVVVVGHGRSLDLRIFYVCHRRLRAEHNLGLLIPLGPGPRELSRRSLPRASVYKG